MRTTRFMNYAFLACLLVGCAQGAMPTEEVDPSGFKTSLPDQEQTGPTNQSTTTGTPTNNASDEGPLRLTVEEPLRGAVVEGTEVVVSGTVENLGGGEVLVNGNPVQVDAQGGFSARVQSRKGLNRIITEVQRGQEFAEDRRAFVFGARASASDKIEQAVTIHVGSQGLLRVGEIIGRTIEQLDIGALIRDSGGDSEEFKVKEVNFGRVAVTLIPTNGQLNVQLAIRDLEIKFRGRFNILFIPVVVHGEVNSNEVDIGGQLNIRQTTDGSIGLDLVNPRVNLDGFRFRIDNVPGFITNLFQDTARSEGQKLLTKTLEDFVVPALFTDELLSQEIEIMGK
ncbi:MAG: hypothetical protein ACPGQS_13085, partial [Bradymonadia bacterium]